MEPKDFLGSQTCYAGSIETKASKCLIWPRPSTGRLSGYHFRPVHLVARGERCLDN